MDTLEDILNWIKEERDRIPFYVNKININNLNQWSYREITGDFYHDTGGFFKIEGLKIKLFEGETYEWEQPIINQNEIGLLGFLIKKFNNEFYFLTQAKIEPGNINGVQLSPTIQATKSNFEVLHKGKKPNYIEYFDNNINNNILIDSLKSEHGSYFLKKRNRNLIIQTKEDIPLKKGYRWISLKNLKKLIMIDNMVNMDARCLLSNISYSFEKEFLEIDYHLNFKKYFLKDYLINSEKSKNSLQTILNYISFLRNKYKIDTSKIKLNKIENWKFLSNKIGREDGKYFNVIGIEANIQNRERSYWHQPMIENNKIGICTLIGKFINNIFHIIIHAKLECGNIDIIEFGPTIQLINTSILNSNIDNIPFYDYQNNINQKRILFSTLQSEEGGRFYHVNTRYTLIHAENNFDNNLPEGYIWITFNQLAFLNRFDNYINIYLRNFLTFL